MMTPPGGYVPIMHTEELEAHYGLPEPISPRPVREGRRITGHRVVVGRVVADLDVMLWDRGLIAASDVFEDSGRLWVRVVEERLWWEWQLSDDPARPPRCPNSRAWPAYLCFLE